MDSPVASATPRSAAPAAPQPAWEARFARLLTALTLAALALRTVRLGAQSLWIDEILTYGWIQEIDRNGFGTLLGNIHGPLYTAVVWLISRGSHAEAWLRLPSVVAGAAAVPAFGLLARALWGARAGLVAAALLTVSPFALYYSQECRNYSFSILFAALALHAAWRFRQVPSARGAAWVALAELAGILSNLNGLFFTAGLGVWGLWIARRNRRACVAWCAAHAVLGVLLVPYAWEITHQVRPERLVGIETNFGEKTPLRGATTLHPLALPYTGFAFAAGYSLGPSLEELRAHPAAVAAPRHLPALGLVLAGFAVPLLCGVWRERRGRGLLLVPALVTAGWTVWFAATNVKPFNVRYLSVAFPAFLLFVAAGSGWMARRWRTLVLAAAFAASLWSCGNYLFVPRYGRDDARGAVQYVAQHAAAPDVIVQISLTATLRHYYRDLGTRPVHPPAEASRDLAAATKYFAALVPGDGVVWYLECRPLGIDPNGVLRKALQARATAQERRSFVGITVHRFRVGPA